ncbi:Guanine nucleotide-binding protein subunit beta-2-like 1 [Folsomia candida]|uniref:Guanine nucleotide-binding protein subunit beta-2-like 1 n=1 Tax=Folsomia candida TaxID=158441 RepID=A0A226F299_FOLCA|nr:Guanine nucleotide-binding protein subunit beta-2-like 1 [Folsomia candida]
MWGTRWALITEIHPQTAKITHLIEHPNGRAVLSFSADQTIFAWSLDSKLKVCLAPLSSVGLTWNPEFPIRTVVYTQDNAVRIINPVSGRILKSALVNPPKPQLSSLVYIPQYETIYVLKTSAEDPNSLEIQIFDGTQNPCRIKETWSEMKWDTSVTAIALFDYHKSLIVPEKGLLFTAKKQAEITEAVTFLIAGTRDGCLCRIDPISGHLEYKTECHKGQVNQIEINPELSQFISLGAEPSLRLWKVELSKEEQFVPLLDISWKYPIRHVAHVREVLAFALSHHDSGSHKVVMFNTSETERHDHRQHFAHAKEILSLSSCRELMLFCSASKDETIRVWNEKAELVRLLVLNWCPSCAGFGTRQGDILVGIDNNLHVIPADKYLSVIYRNRALMDGLTAGEKEGATPLNAARSGQDPRMYLVLEEEDRFEREAKEREKERDKDKSKKPAEHAKEQRRKQSETDFMEEKIPPIGPFHEPKDSQRSQDYAKYAFLEEDLKQIVEGNHQFSIYVPDFRKMTKKQLDDYGKTIFPEDGNKRKMFASESRIDCLHEMEKHAKDIGNNEGNI